MTPASVRETLRAVLRDILGLGEARAAALDDDSPLFGALPELDSMAVTGLLTELEDRLGVRIDDDTIDDDWLLTFGSLFRFVMDKAVK